MSVRDRSDSEGSEDQLTPPGWEYNPSTREQRLPLVGLALIGFLIASYLSLFQLDIISSVWDPFFGKGTRTILTSRVSDVLPVPDAALGAFGYLVDAISGVIGGKGRWKSMPWIVIIFGLAVGPLGLVSIMLVIFQPVLFDAWCSLCLASAVISIIIIGPAMDEFLASAQYVRREMARGRSGWRVFWGLAS